jgi:hypothetical protein
VEDLFDFKSEVKNMLMRIQQTYNEFIANPPIDVDISRMVDIKTEVRLIIKLYLAHGGSFPSQNKAAWKSWAPYLRASGWSGRAIVAHENMVNNNIRQLSDMVSSKFDKVIEQGQVERKEILGMYVKKCDTHDSKMGSIQEDHKSTIDSIDAKYDGKMQVMKEEYECKMQASQDKHDSKINTIEQKYEGKIQSMHDNATITMNAVELKHESKLRALEESNKEMYQLKVDNGVMASKVNNQSKELKRAITGNESYKRDNAVKGALITRKDATIKSISSANEVLTKKLQIKTEELKYANNGSSNNSGARVIKIKRARDGYATRSQRRRY